MKKNILVHKFFLPFLFLIITSYPLKLFSNVVGDIKIIEKKISEVNEKEKYTINIVFPQIEIEDGGIMNKINNDLEGVAYQYLNDFKSEIEEYNNLIGDSVLLNSKSTMSELDIFYVIENNSSKILSFRFSKYTYFLGNAHPNRFFDSKNYDAISGSLIYLPDIFKRNEDYLNILSNYSKKRIFSTYEKEGIEIDSSWIKKGTAPADSNYNVFFLKKEGLRIVFNTYQIAPYAMGPYEVDIPYSDLQNILRTE